MMTIDSSVVLTVVFLICCVNGISKVESRAIEHHSTEHLRPLVAAYRVKRKARSDNDQAVTSLVSTAPSGVVKTIADTTASDIGPSGEEIDIDDPRDTTVHDIQQLLGTNRLSSGRRKRSLQRHQQSGQRRLLEHQNTSQKTRLRRRINASQVMSDDGSVKESLQKLLGDAEKDTSSVFDDDDSIGALILRQRRQLTNKDDTTDHGSSDSSFSDYDISRTNKKWPSSKLPNQIFRKEEIIRGDIGPTVHSAGLRLSDDKTNYQYHYKASPKIFALNPNMFANLHRQDTPSSYKKNLNAVSDTTTITADVDLFLAESSDGSLDLDASASSSDSSSLDVSSKEFSLNNKKTVKRRIQSKALNTQDDETNGISTDLSYIATTNSHFLSSSSSELLETSTRDSHTNSTLEERGSESDTNTMRNIPSVSSSAGSLSSGTLDVAVTHQQTDKQEASNNQSYPSNDFGSQQLPQENEKYVPLSDNGTDFGQPANASKKLNKTDEKLEERDKGIEPSYEIKSAAGPQTSGTETDQATKAVDFKDSKGRNELILQTLISQTSPRHVTPPSFTSKPSANPQLETSPESVAHGRHPRIARSLAYEEVIEDPNSGYTQWEQWSACSKHCGVGNAERRRTCVHRSRCKSGDIEIKLCVNEERPNCKNWRPTF